MSTANLSVSAWSQGKNIFITGGTGFLGICLVEKLLRCAPDVNNIYLLMRPKRGKEITERLEDLKKNPIFDTFKSSNDDIERKFGKVKAVAGDVGLPDLGINPVDRQMLVQNIDVIFHSAATLDFADTLKSAIDINLLGTRRCLQLAKECQHLDVFVHVSSAYVNSFLLETDEILYDLKQDPEELIRMSEELSEEELEKRAPNILGDHPNSYTLTKQMAEHEVKSCEQLFACTIVRPSMITTAWKEPVPGWTMSKNGPQGFVMGATRGVLRRLPVGKDLVYDYIPVDIVCNQLVISAQHASMTRARTVEIYHCTSSTSNPFRWRKVENKINNMFHKYPLMNSVWYPRLILLPSVWRFKLSALFVHILPAIFLDLFLFVTGGRPILMKLHRNVMTSLDRLSTFIFTEWKFNNEKTRELQSWINEGDSDKFNLDVSTLNWEDYFEDLAKGVRIFLSKEKMDNIKKAKAKDNLLFKLWLGLKVGLHLSFWYLLSSIFNLGFFASLLIFPLTLGIASFI